MKQPSFERKPFKLFLAFQASHQADFEKSEIDPQRSHKAGTRMFFHACFCSFVSSTLCWECLIETSKFQECSYDGRRSRPYCNLIWRSKFCWPSHPKCARKIKSSFVFSLISREEKINGFSMFSMSSRNSKLASKSKAVPSELVSAFYMIYCLQILPSYFYLFFLFK